MNTNLYISGYHLEIDPNETSKAYSYQLASCDCAYCRNFYAASSSIPRGLAEFLDSLGADSLNPVYISEICANPDGSHFYSLFYDVIGRIISMPVSSEGSTHISNAVSLDGIPESITARIAKEPYAPGHFPPPAIEFEFFLNLPWALEEDPYEGGITSR
jgi:hypothetical protein